jgi:hypothetical protein
VIFLLDFIFTDHSFFLSFPAADIFMSPDACLRTCDKIDYVLSEIELLVADGIAAIAGLYTIGTPYFKSPW